jgi:hypothetical protein
MIEYATKNLSQMVKKFPETDDTSASRSQKNSTVTVVAQWAKAPGIHCYVAGSIPAVTPRYCTKKIENALWSTKKGKKNARKEGKIYEEPLKKPANTEQYTGHSSTKTRHRNPQKPTEKKNNGTRGSCNIKK